MANTTFSGPIKAGNIFNTTGTTVGTNVANVGFVVMSQTDTIAFGNTTDKSLSIVIPANSQLVDIKVFVITAFNAGTTNTLDIGIVGDSDLYVEKALSVASSGAATGELVLVTGSTYTALGLDIPSGSTFTLNIPGSGILCPRGILIQTALNLTGITAFTDKFSGPNLTTTNG
jgi:hypothetical protein